MRAAFAIVLMVWLVLPLVPLAVWSFAKGWRFPALVPQDWTVRAWNYALSDASGVLASLGVTAWIAVCATVISLLLGVPAGRALGLYRFRGKGIVQLMLLAPIIVPGIAVGLGLQTVFIGLGLTQTVTGVVIVHLIPVLPYVVLVMAGIFANYDVAYEAQARTLGASRWQVARHVMLPAIMPGVMVAGMFAFLVSWSQYVLTLVVGAGRVETLPLLLFNFVASGRNDIAGAIAMIYIVPGVLIVALTARHVTGRNAAMVRG